MYYYEYPYISTAYLIINLILKVVLFIINNQT